ncbi:uncharacterized protein LTR77_010446 [Saxophila tyrrhenica]|uniref:Uncharacterized protein n=1 Tax=Saxophila tyrrhenica TaxID=1690608 RepID=A0AAV9NYU2_9PEZI|nr:hypothetical protein LTR77_010446 [Saxophila tyrrhenica]
MFVLSFALACSLLFIGFSSHLTSCTKIPDTTRSAESGPYRLLNVSRTNAPQRSNSNATLTASNYDDAVKCWNDWDSYSAWSTTCPKTTIPYSTYTLSDHWTYTEYETFKLCDGHPRAVANGGWRTSYSTESDITYPFQTITLTTITYEFPPSGIPAATVTTTGVSVHTQETVTCASPAPTPSCTIDDKNCASLFSAWTADGFTRSKPPCYYPEPGDACDACALFVPSVKLLYWPVSMTGDFCGSDYRIATPTHPSNLSTPETLLYSGHTLTSGSAYRSYAGVTALATAGSYCGTPLPAGILPLPSASLSSYRGHAAAMPIADSAPWPFNFADLAPNPVPWDAWISQDLCFNHQSDPACQTVTQAAYRPWLVYPREFFGMEREWSKCVTGAFGIVDPPTALPKAEVEVVPTMSRGVERSATAAEPGMGSEGSLGGTQTPAPELETTRGVIIPKESRSRAADPTDSAIEPHVSSRPEATSQEKHGTKLHVPNTSGSTEKTYPKPVPPLDSPADPTGGASDADHASSVNPVDPVDPITAPLSAYGASTQAQATTIFNIPTTALANSKVFVGSQLLSAGSEGDAVSLGTHILSQGEKTRIGGTFVSLGSKTLVVGVLPTPPPTDPEPPNALSVLSEAQTEGRPTAKVTVGGETFTAYSGGIVVGGETTYEPGRSIISAGGEALSLGSHGVVVGGTTIGFEAPSDAPSLTANDASGEQSAPAKATRSRMELTFAHGTTWRTTVTGTIDRSGHTIVSMGKSTFTYSGQSAVVHGTTFRLQSTAKGSSQESSDKHSSAQKTGGISGLPSIVYAPRPTSSGPLPSIVDPSGEGGSRASSTSTSSSTSSASSLGLSDSLDCLRYGMALIFLLSFFG